MAAGKRHLSPKGTAGAGFAFEDDVVAWLAAHLLAGVAPWPGAGRLRSIQCQTANRGWRPDDVLLTLVGTSGDYRCAGSIKDMVPLTPHGFAPATDFRDEAATLYRGGCAISPPFDPDCDRIALIGRGVGQEVWANWEALESAVRVGRDDLTLSQAAQAMLAGTGGNAGLLRCVHVVDLGRCRPLAAVCADLLRDGEPDWLAQDLLALAQDIRHGGGTLDLESLVQNLRSKHLLTAYADHRRDWAKLLAVGRELIEEIPVELAGYQLPRDAELTAVAAEFARPDVRAVVLLGESGSGKTVTAKLWLAQRDGACDLWWDNDTFDAAGATAWRSELGLQHPLDELCAAVPAASACLVLDNADRLLGTDCWQNVGRLLRALDLGSATSAWRLVLTCEAEAWDEVRHQLEAHGLPRGAYSTVPVASPTRQELAPLLAAYPALYPLLDRPHLSSLLTRPKMLALVLPRLDEVGGLVCESELIDWVWRAHVEVGRPARARAAQVLGRRQAERSTPRVPLTDLEQADVDCLQELRRDGICRYRDGVYGFAHDLYGDWARLHFLRDAALPTPLTLLWQRALRLLGVHRLEQAGADAWRRLLEAAAERPDAHEVEGRLLEALALASTAEACLTELWPLLLAAEGGRLRRWLTLFQQVATEAVPSLGADFRRPRWHLWPPVLRTLLARWDDVARLAPVEFAQVATTWLTPVFGEQELSREVAQAAVALAERVAGARGADRRVRGEEQVTPIYRAALRAAPWWPNRVAAFALERVARTGAPDCGPFTEPFTHRELPPVAPWPDGPRRRIDAWFGDLCLESLDLVGLIRHRPAVAREVLLAALIAWRRPDDMFDDRLMTEDRVRLRHDPWMVKFHDRGPFWLFLQLQPNEAIECIQRLVNFATERWLETVPPAAPVVIEPWGTWLGDDNAFRWYRDEQFAAGSVAIALMALEKWLYDLADKAGVAALEPWLTRIIAGSRSVAFAGLLAALAVRHPELLRGALRPLLTVWEFLLWDAQRAVMTTVQPHICLPQVPRDTLWEWHRLPHREESLSNAVLRSWMLFADEEQPFFAAVRARWQADWPGPSEADTLTPQFDPTNYSIQETIDGQQALVYSPPADVQAHAAARQSEMQLGLLCALLPSRCHQLLEAGRPDLWQRRYDPWTEPAAPPEPLPDQASAELWQQAQQLEAMAGDPERASQLESYLAPADALCGVAAVLALRSGDWPDAPEEVGDWCLRTLVSTVIKPPHRTGDGALAEHPEVLADMSWCGFAAEAMPEVLTALPDVREVRWAAALLATDNHYSTVARLMQAAGEVRAELGADFDRLRRLALEHAVVWHSDVLRGHAWERAGRPADQSPANEWHPWRIAQATAMGDGSLDATVPQLSALATWPPSPWPARRDERHPLDPGLDVEFLRAALAWLGPPDAAADEAERAEWLGWWRDIAAFQARRLDGGEPWGGPGGIHWDEWVRSALAQVIVRLRPDEQPEALWRPLLRCAATAPRWVAFMIQMCFHAGLQDQAREPAMVRQWQTMIDFALAARVLDQATDVATALMGCWATSSPPWEPEHARVLVAMREHLARWAAAYADRQPVWEALTRLLRLPAAEGLRRDGLCWLAAACPDRPDQLVGHPANNLARLLVVVNDQHGGALAADARVQAAFNTLVGLLGDHPESVRFR